MHTNMPDELRVTLRPTVKEDVPRLFEIQDDPDANALAGTKPRSRETFYGVWERVFADPGVIPRTILVNGAVAGSVNQFKKEGIDAVGYWIDRAWWGRGVTSRAVALFLAEVRTRPLIAHVAVWNAASHRVLLKNGFRRTGTFMGEETERYISAEVVTYVLDA